MEVYDESNNNEFVWIVNSNEFVVFQNCILMCCLIWSCLNVLQLRESFCQFNFLNISFSLIKPPFYGDIQPPQVHSDFKKLVKTALRAMRKKQWLMISICKKEERSTIFIVLPRGIALNLNNLMWVLATIFPLHERVTASEIWGKVIKYLLISFIFKYYLINLKCFKIIDSQYSQANLLPLAKKKKNQMKIY